MPCPNSVDIPENISNYNNGIAFDKAESARGMYAWRKYAYEVQKTHEHDVRAASCTQCKQCEDKCPQHIPISRWMPIIVAVLGEGRPFVRELPDA